MSLSYYLVVLGRIVEDVAADLRCRAPEERSGDWSSRREGWEREEQCDCDTDADDPVLQISTHTELTAINDPNERSASRQAGLRAIRIKSILARKEVYHIFESS